MKYDVWHCKLVLLRPNDEEQLTDSYPRRVVIDVCCDVWGGDAVVSCFSGWGGKLSAKQEEIVDRNIVSERAKSMIADLKDMTNAEKQEYLEEFLLND